ncbi:MAG: glycosyltransferase [Bacteroidetes bacterium]|nr:glycosyltransferase [Bacteroidota bacterium]
MNNLTHLAIVIGSLRMGGAEKAAVHLANEFASRGIRVDLVLVNADGEFMSSLDPAVRVVDLQAGKTRNAGKPFYNYLRKENPQVIIAIQSHVQLMVLMTRHRYRMKIPVILNEQSLFSANVPAQGLKNFIFRLLIKKYFPMADAVAAVSTASALDFTNCFPELKGRVDIIYNPVLSKVVPVTKFQIPDHPFLHDKTISVIMSAGRLVPSKDFPTLLRAFAVMNKAHNARLIILGEGGERGNLIALSAELGIKDFVSLPGFISNPMSWMNYASVFVLSSEYEGLPFVLVEAMAAGCQVVSTDCPGGSSEILGDGKYGALVPVHDHISLAAAISEAIKHPIDAQQIRRRSEEFTAPKVVSNYLELISKLINRNEQRP